MSKLWLILIKENGKTYKFDTEELALEYVGKIIVGEISGTTIQKIYKADTTSGSMSELEVVLNEYSLEFQVKP